MRQVVLLAVSLSVCAAASDTIKPLFETSSIAEYNQWLWQHRDEYPGFRPVRTQADFFSDSGAALPSQVLEYYSSLKGLVGLQTSSVHYLIDGDHCVVCYGRGRVVTSTAYDLHRHRLFERTGQVHPRFNLWFRDTEDSGAAWRHFHHQNPPAPESTQILDDDGKVVGVLPRVSAWRATSSGDTLIAAVSHSGTVVFDREARIRRRDSMFGTASRIAAISPAFNRQRWLVIGPTSSSGRTIAVALRYTEPTRTLPIPLRSGFSPKRARRPPSLENWTGTTASSCSGWETPLYW